jgi:hypothetical protein
MFKNFYYALLVVAESILPMNWFARLIGIPVQYLLAYQVIDEVAIQLGLYTFDTKLWKNFKEDCAQEIFQRVYLCDGDWPTYKLKLMCDSDSIAEKDERWIVYNAFLQHGDVDQHTLDEIPGLREWLDEVL